MNAKKYIFKMNSMLGEICALRRQTIGSTSAFAMRAAMLTAAACVLSLLSACGGGGGSTSTSDSSTSGAITYTLSGTLSGLADGQTLNLSNGGETLTRSTNGVFTFATHLVQGGSYEVKVSGAQPAWQNCRVSQATGSAVSANVSSVVVNCVSTDTAATGLLNDTGIDWCSQNITTGSWVNNVLCATFNWGSNFWGQQQDAYFGRDAQAKAGTLTKVGGGMAGFDFTKIGASGKVLAKQGETWSDNGTEAASTQWDCVRDNVTGLVWEVKRNDATHLRHMGHAYAWYNTDTTSNGSTVGYEAPLDDAYGNPVTAPTCAGVANVAKCNTQSYVTAVNAVGLCGKKDWRLPTLYELRSMVHAGRINPTADTDYFPNTPAIWTWSSSPNVNDSDHAWSIDFLRGLSYSDQTRYANRVRLVRSAL